MRESSWSIVTVQKGGSDLGKPQAGRFFACNVWSRLMFRASAPNYEKKYKLASGERQKCRKESVLVYYGDAR
jgi:hypothetical protein